MFYETPERHTSLSREEYAHIKHGRENETDSGRFSWRRLLKYRQVWAIVLARFVTDPVWWLYITWLPLYLNRVRGFSLKQIGMFAWLPFVAADAAVCWEVGSPVTSSRADGLRTKRVRS
jgi:ACS family hexuronate transporter-like MFS transporter